jgi:carboxylate-amine ligase
VITRLVASLRPELEECADWEFVSALAADALPRGSSAARQRRAFARRGELADVVDLLLAETRPGEWGDGGHCSPAASG